MTRKKAEKVGSRYWDSYKPGNVRLYQLQEVVNIRGGVTALSSWMTAAERRKFIEGWHKSDGRKKLPSI